MLGPLILLLPSHVPAARAEASIEVTNVARQVAEDAWEWTAYVAGPQDALGNIQCVTYTLHPTFPQPVQKVCGTSNPQYPFGLTVTGWGTFMLRARVDFKDGTSQDVNYFLDFSKHPL